MPTATAKDGVQLHYALHDYTDEWKKAPVLVLQHGFGRSSRFWYSMIPHLARFYKVVCPDLRGLGQSTQGFRLEDGLSVEKYISDLVSIIDATGEEKVHYAGESLGGILGMALAALHPDRVRTLSLLAAPLIISKELQMKHAAGRPSWEQALRELGSAGWSRAMNSATRFPPDTDPGLLEFFATETGKNNVEVLIAMSQLAAEVDATPFLDRINAPTLGIYPSAGPATSNDQMEKLKAGIKNLRIVSIPSKYHMVYVLKSTICAKHILYFMGNHDGIPCHE
jgi:3-oxoadipate enol-lactonase